jgi:surface antigen
VRWPAGGLIALAVLVGPALTGVLTDAAAAQGYEPNCVNVVLRDSFWGQFRRAIETGGDAAGVPDALARAGFVVSDVPSVGAVMAWPRSTYGASPSGHVGIVTAVREDGAVVVRHENWPYGALEHTEVFAVRPGLRFVHLPSVMGDGSGTERAAPGSDAARAAQEPNAVGAPAVRVHVIRAGDTLYALARANDTTIDALVAVNELGSAETILSIGRQLRIP